jgi:hypothetical protein
MNNRTLTPYRLPDGRIVPVDASAAKGAAAIDFTLEDGQIVQATRVTAIESPAYFLGAIAACVEAAERGSRTPADVLLRIRTLLTQAGALKERTS